jgi:hypothetical protein
MIVFCTTCKGRAQHIERTLPKNLADNQGANSKFVLLDYNSPDNLLGYLRKNHRQAIESGKLVIYSYAEPGPFRMAHAKNMAHRLGIMEGGDILVNLDADNFTGPGFADYIEERFQEEDIFLWARMVKEGPGRLARGIAGRIVVSAKAFINAGGYDEKFETWAPDDADFTARLERLGYIAREIDRLYLDAVLHNERVRFREYPHARKNIDDYDLGKLIESDATISNFGKCGIGRVFRNFSRWATEILALPTRIFGIGMHKTATRSLNAALRALGLDSMHWENPQRAKAIWQEMPSGRSETIEKHYAACDLPITLLYEQLDKAYPGSKFILTVRDEEKWLKSVKNHWSYEYNGFRASWDQDPITHHIHQALYGQKHFESELFIARYRRHNAEVKEYFKNRPDDLLVMEMDEGAGWLELCGFLGKPIPPFSYPREYATVTYAA